jgi:hypothetical protein
MIIIELLRAFICDKLASRKQCLPALLESNIFECFSSLYFGITSQIWRHLTISLINVLTVKIDYNGATFCRHTFDTLIDVFPVLALKSDISCNAFLAVIHGHFGFMNHDLWLVSLWTKHNVVVNRFRFHFLLASEKPRFTFLGLEMEIPEGRAALLLWYRC